MKDEIIEIQCPFCGAILSVKNCPGIEDKYVTCPMCKHRARFRLYNKLNPYFDCNKISSIDSIMYRFTLSEEDSYKGNGIRQRDQRCIEYPCSISIIKLDEDNVFHIENKDEELQSLIKNIKFENNQIENIRCRIRDFEKKWELSDTYYLCPVCGNVMIVTSWPREFSDDYVCECPCCDNGFYFGGTRFSEDEAKQINEFSVNPIILARNVYTSKTNMIAKMLQSEVLLFDNYRLIMKASDNGFLVTHIMVLNA